MSRDDDYEVDEPSEEIRREKARARLDIVEALLRASTLLGEILAAVSECPDRASALSALQEPPFSFSEIGAHHVLDFTVGRQVTESRRLLAAEAEDLRSIAEGIVSPPHERRVVNPPAEPASFVRLVPGPDHELAIAGGTVRLIGVEIYDLVVAVLWRQLLPDDVVDAYRATRVIMPTLEDDAGTEYHNWEGTGFGPGRERYGRTRFLPAPPPDASRLIVGLSEEVTVEIPLEPQESVNL